MYIINHFYFYYYLLLAESEAWDLFRDKLLVKPLLSPLVGNTGLFSCITAVEDESPDEWLSVLYLIKKIIYFNKINI